MNFSLHPRWRDILKRAWSVRFMALGGLFGSVSAALPLAQPYLNLDPLIVACTVGVCTMGTTVAAILSRIVSQKGLT